MCEGGEQRAYSPAPHTHPNIQVAQARCVGADQSAVRISFLTKCAMFAMAYLCIERIFRPRTRSKSFDGHVNSESFCD